MDYIQQAIEKARDERQGNIGQKAESSGQKRSEVGEQSGQGGVPETINYTTTRKETVSRKVLKANRIVAGFESDPTTDAYRQLRTQTLQKLRANGWKTLGITSPGENAGKTVTALNLAISLSKEVNQTVLLVDMDLRSPGIMDALGLSTEYGIVDHLNDDISISDIMVTPGFERLVILPSKQDDRYSSELLSAPKMKTLLNDLTSRYDSRLIIFDMPSLLVNDDALVFTPFVDAMLLVVEDGASSEHDIHRSMELLDGTELLGTVLNKMQ